MGNNTTNTTNGNSKTGSGAAGQAPGKSFDQGLGQSSDTDSMSGRGNTAGNSSQGTARTNGDDAIGDQASRLDESRSASKTSGSSRDLLNGDGNFSQ